jgi:predicted aspartyl protease
VQKENISTVGAPSGGARVLEMPRKARRRRSSPDAEELESDREVSPSSHRRRRLNVARSSPDSTANDESSVSLNDILSVIQNSQTESRRQFEDGQAEVRLLIEQSQAESRRLMEEGQADICQRFYAVEQSMRGEIVDVSTRVEDVSDHINVVADQVDRIAEHVGTVNGCLENVVSRLQKLEHDQSASSPSGDRVDAATKEVGRTRSGRQYTGQQVVRRSRQPSTAVDYATTDTEGESGHHTSIDRGCEVMERSSHNSHSSHSNPVSRSNNRRNVTVNDNKETRPCDLQARISNKSLRYSNVHGKKSCRDNDCCSEAESSEESDREVTFVNVGKQRATAARSDDCERQSVGASCTRVSRNNGNNGESATFRNDETFEDEFDAKDCDLHVGNTRTCYERLPVTHSPVGKSRHEVRTSPNSYVHRSEVIDARPNKTYRTDEVTECDRMSQSSKRDAESVVFSRKLHKQSAVLGSYDGSIDLDIFLSKFESCSRYFDWSPEDRLFQLKLALNGPAAQILHANNCPDSMDRILSLLRTRFGTDQKCELYRLELKQRRRKPNESLQQLFHDVCRLMNLAYNGHKDEIVETLARDYFLDALNSHSMKVRIMERNAKTIDEALRLAMRYEAYDNSDPARQVSHDANAFQPRNRYVRKVSNETNVKEVNEGVCPVVSKSSRQSVEERLDHKLAELERKLDSLVKINQPPLYANQVSNYGNCGAIDGMPSGPVVYPTPVVSNSLPNNAVCYNGGLQNGYSSFQNRKRQKLSRDQCANCFAFGHWRYNCPVSNTEVKRLSEGREVEQTRVQMHSDASQSNARLYSVKSRSGNAEVYLKGKIGNSSTFLLLDTGCEISVIGKNLLGDIELIPTQQKLFAANSTEIPVLGETDVTINIQGKSFKTRVTVSEHVESAILGMDFMSMHSVKWDFDKKSVCIDGHWFKLTSKPKSGLVRRVYIENDKLLPAKHGSYVPVRLTVSNLNRVAEAWALDSSVIGDGIFSANVVVPNDSFRAVLPILNTSEADMALKQGTYVGCAKAATIIDAPFAACLNDVTLDANREVVSQPLSLVERNSAHCCMVTTPEESSVTKREVEGDYDHMKCIFDSLPETLSREQREKAIDLLKSKSDIFSKGEYDLGRTQLLLHHIDTGSHAPVRQTLRRHPMEHVPIIDKFVDDMLENKIISPSSSDWASNVLLVRRADKSWRFCVDQRALNAVTTKCSFPMPRIDACLDALGGAKWYSVMDLRSAFYQVGLDPTTAHKTAFITRKGLFQFNVLNFGQCNSPATFSKLLSLVMTGLQWEICICFLDDLVIFSHDFDSHLKRLSLVFERLKWANLKLKPTKCFLFQSKVRFLGHVVSESGIEPDPAKISCLENFKLESAKDVSRFLGFANYYRKFLYDYASIAKSLVELTRKNVPFVMTPEREHAFATLKEKLTSYPVLALPIDDGKYVIDTDASDHSVAAILHQEQEGVLRVIAYASRTLNAAERSYCATRKELLGVIFGLKTFRTYVLGRHFTLRTDHASLTHLLKSPEPVGQQARYLDFLAEFNFSIVHRSGKCNANADFVSRIKPCIRDGSAATCKQCLQRKLCVTEVDKTQVDVHNTELPTCNAVVDAERNCNVIAVITRSKSKSSRELLLENAKYLQGSDLSPDKIRQEQMNDSEIAPVIELMKRSTDQPSFDDLKYLSSETQQLCYQWDSLKLHDGILYREFVNPDCSILCYQLIVPRSLRTAVITQLHAGVGSLHQSLPKCLETLKRFAWWKTIRSDTEREIRKCDVCGRSRKWPNAKQD